MTLGVHIDVSLVKKRIDQDNSLVPIVDPHDKIVTLFSRFLAFLFIFSSGSARTLKH